MSKKNYLTNKDNTLQALEEDGVKRFEGIQTSYNNLQFKPAEQELIDKEYKAWVNDDSMVEECKKYSFMRGYILMSFFACDLSKYQKESNVIGLGGENLTQKASTYIFNIWKVISVANDLIKLKPEYAMYDLKEGDLVTLEDELFNPMFVEDFNMPEGNNPANAARPVINTNPLSRVARHFFDPNKLAKTIDLSKNLYLMPSDYLRAKIKV